MFALESAESFLISSFLVTLLELLFASILLFTINGALRYPASLLRMGIGFAIAGVAYPVLGFDLMYGGEIGSTFQALFPTYSTESLVGYEFGEYSNLSDLVFQCRFAIASVMYLTLALGSSLSLPRLVCLQTILTAFLYPFFGKLTWGGGWLQSLGFHNFSGAALIGAIPAALALASIYLNKPSFESPIPKQLLLAIGIFILILRRALAIIVLSFASDTPLSVAAFETEIYTSVIALLATILVSLYRKQIRLEIPVTCYLALAIAELAISIEYPPVLLVAVPRGPWHELALPAVTFLLATTATLALMSKRINPAYFIPINLLTGALSGLLVEAYLNPSVSPAPQLAGILAATSLSILTAFLAAKFPVPPKRPSST